MKTPLKKLRGFGLHKHEKRDRYNTQRSLAQLDELSQASQDMQDMRDCYDSLLSAAAATANSSYEFSESLREMGDCLLEKTALNDDEDSGRVLLMLGKVQFEIQKLVDNYRSHISRTITIPSESLLNELRIVEDMKKQCDEKRMFYEEMITKCKEKGKLKGSSIQHLQSAQDEFDEEATIFVFRMKSLKRGQSHSLLTQAARHHAAQLYFFRKALKCLEAIEPHVKLVTEQQHIDYQFSGLEDDDMDSVFLTDDDEDDEDDSDDGNDTREDGELSFDYRQKDEENDVSTSGNTLELDNVDLTFPQVASVNAAMELPNRRPIWNSSSYIRDLNAGSKSAPLSAENHFDPTERFRQMRQSSSRKLNTYVLPTPLETKSPFSSGSEAQVPRAKQSPNIWHSSPLEHKKYEDMLGKGKFSGPIVSNAQSVLKESNNNNNNKPSPLPPPSTEGRTSPPLDPRSVSAAKKIKRHAFSGPLTSNSQSNNPMFSASGSISSTGHPQLFSGSLLCTPLTRRPSTIKLSSLGSTFMSSPKISELHELPRPPPHLASKKPSYSIGFSAPLVSSKGMSDHTANNKSVASSAASTLPVPPETISRSNSIPSHGSTSMESPNLKMVEGIASPTLTLISLQNS